jgi:hypothetical protein
VLVGLGGTALSWLVSRPIVAPDWLRDRIASRAAEALPGLTLGFSDLVMIVDDGWTPRIRLRDVSLASAEGLPIMSLGEIEVGVSGEALLRGKIQP